MDGNYRNEDILLNILVSTVDKILEWCDITDRYNLDVPTFYYEKQMSF